MDKAKINRAAAQLRGAKSLVVLTGAGISKESGVPTFRDALNGLWSTFDPQKLATPEAFTANPKLVWDWYEYRRNMLKTVKPNAGHYALTALEDMLPQVVIVTQNIDGLHRQAGSSDVLELHGNIARHKCFANCRGEPTLIDLETLTWNPQNGPPYCPHCGAYIRPDVVWFNEYLPLDILDRAKTLSDNADVMLIVGTSGVVQPAASLPHRAKLYNNAFLIDVNPEPDELTLIADVYLAGPSGEILPRIIQAMRNSL